MSSSDWVISSLTSLSSGIFAVVLLSSGLFSTKASPSAAFSANVSLSASFSKELSSSGLSSIEVSSSSSFSKNGSFSGIFAMVFSSSGPSPSDSSCALSVESFAPNQSSSFTDCPYFTKKSSSSPSRLSLFPESSFSSCSCDSVSAPTVEEVASPVSFDRSFVSKDSCSSFSVTGNSSSSGICPFSCLSVLPESFICPFEVPLFTWSSPASLSLVFSCVSSFSAPSFSGSFSSSLSVPFSLSAGSFSLSEYDSVSGCLVSGVLLFFPSSFFVPSASFLTFSVKEGDFPLSSLLLSSFWVSAALFSSAGSTWITFTLALTAYAFALISCAITSIDWLIIRS